MHRLHLRSDLALIVCTAMLRAVTVGFIGVVLGVFLFRNRFSPARIGVVIGSGLAGAAIATMLSAKYVDHLGRRRSLAMFTALSALPVLVLAWKPGFAWLVPVAFFGMLNAMGTDRSAMFAVEQAILPGLVADAQRTWVLSWYNVALDAGTAIGALLASVLPLVGYRSVLSGLALLSAAAAVAYLFLSPSVETPVHLDPEHRQISRETRRIVTRLSALFSLDAFGGGLLADALIAYWFFRRFGVSEQALGLLFAVIHVLNAASHLGAAWLARRIGLLNTMVFTHIPSSLFLLAVPFAPSFPVAAALLLCRESLVEMDVPTRQSYTAAVVRPAERTFAAATTNVARNAGWAASASFSGLFMRTLTLAAPIFIGSSLKIAYDIAMYFSFRALKPPEESAGSPPTLATSSGP